MDAPADPTPEWPTRLTGVGSVSPAECRNQHALDHSQRQREHYVEPAPDLGCGRAAHADNQAQDAEQHQPPAEVELLFDRKATRCA
jgi:hypothetical protein